MPDRDWTRIVLSSIGDGVVAADAQGCVTFMNPVAERLTGHRVADVVGRQLTDVLCLIDEESRRPLTDRLVRARHDGPANLPRYMLLVSSDGTELPVEDSVAPIRTADDEIVGVVLVFRDATLQRQAEEQQRRLSAIVETSDDAIFSKRLDGIITSWNEGAARIYGFSAAEMVGRSVAVLMPADRAAELREIIARLKRGERIDHFETVRRRKDGTLIDVSLSISALRDGRGHITGASVIARDVTAHKRAEDRLKASEERLRLAVEGAGLGVWEWDIPTGAVTWMGVEPIHGLPAGSFGGTFDDYARDIHPDDRETVLGAIRAAAATGTGFGLEYRIIRRDGSVHWVEAKGQAHADRTARTTRMAGICTDITERKLIEEERAGLLEREQAARAEAQSASRMKDEFLSVLSHELRTPLNAVLGWTRLLTSGTLEREQAARAIGIIERNAQAQGQLISDLLDVSRVITGTLRLEIRPVSLARVAVAAIESVQVAASTKGVRIEYADLGGAPFIPGDPSRLQQAVWNLVSNAVKFTPAGGRVTVTLEARGTDVTLSVADTGVGISSEFLPHVFDRFRQADTSVSRRYGGLGLGLAIARYLVEAHGGTVTASSEGEGRGAVFTMSLPMTAPESVSPRSAGIGLRRPLPRETALAGVRVLLVEDDDDGRAFLEVVLRQHEAEVISAASVAEAQPLIERFRPHVIVSDLGMPDEDGFALIRQIRAHSSEGVRGIPAIALTGFASLQDRARVLEEGFQLHLSKPVEASEVVTAIASLVSPETPS